MNLAWIQMWKISRWCRKYVTIYMTLWLYWKYNIIYFFFRCRVGFRTRKNDEKSVKMIIFGVIPKLQPSLFRRELISFSVKYPFFILSKPKFWPFGHQKKFSRELSFGTLIEGNPIRSFVKRSTDVSEKFRYLILTLAAGLCEDHRS